MSVKSDRDMFRKRLIAGFNIGSENIFERNIQLRFSAPSRLGLPDTWYWRPVTAATQGLQKLRPNVTFNGTYRDDHSPAIAVDDDPEGTKTIQNSGDWTVRMSLPVGSAFKRLFPRKVEVDSGDRARLLRNIENQVRRGLLEDEELKGLLVDHARERLAHFKTPRRIELVAELERSETGKISRASVPDLALGAGTRG